MTLQMPRIDAKKRKRKRKPLTKSQINKRYRLRHPDRDKASKEKWRINNKDYVNQIQREWLSNLPARKKEQYRRRKNKYMKLYCAENRDRKLAYMKEYNQRPEVKAHRREYYENKKLVRTP